MQKVHFLGSLEDWNAITIANDNEILNSVTIECEGSIVAQSTCAPENSNILWKLYDSGLMSLTGYGAIPNYKHVFPDGTATPVNPQPWLAFKDSIKNVVIGEGIISVGDFSFYHFTNLADISFPSTLKEIRQYSFESCTSLKNIKFPDNLEQIGAISFHGCTSLTNVTIPGTVNVIGSHSFKECSCLEAVTLEDGIEAIDEYAFSYNPLLTYIELPDSLKAIGKDAFSACTSLKRIILPCNLQSIDYQAFFGCTALESVFIPKSIVNIYADSEGFSPFKYCSSSLVLFCEAYGQPDCWGHYRNYYDNAHKLTVYFNITLSDYYNIINNGIETCKCGEEAFWYQNVWSICPGNIEVVGKGAMYDYLTFPWSKSQLYSMTVNIGFGITKVGNNAFSHYTLINQVNISNTVEEIGTSAFDGTNIEELTIPSSVKRISGSAFIGCNKLTKVTLEYGVEIIGDSAFSGTSSLAEINIPESVTQIGNNAFSLSGIKKIVFPDSITQMGTSVLYGSSVYSIVWPASIKTLPDFAFCSCMSLGYYEIPDGITSIGEGAFARSAISSISIPLSVTAIGATAFTFRSGIGFTTSYEGGKEDWNKIDIAEGNDVLTAYMEYYYGKSILNESFFPDANFLSKLQDLYPDGKSLNNLSTISSLDISGCNIDDLKGIEYFTGLTKLICDNNNLTSLNLEPLKNLTHLSCNCNKLTELDLQYTPEITYLSCNYNRLSLLNASSLSSLTYCYFKGNNIKTVDMAIYSADGTENTIFATTNYDGNIDMSEIVGSENIGRVQVISGGIYDSATGIVILNGGCECFIYEYRCSSEGPFILETTVTVVYDGTAELSIPSGSIAYNGNAIMLPNSSGRIQASNCQAGDFINISAFKIDSSDDHNSYPATSEVYRVVTVAEGNAFTRVSGMNSLMQYSGASIRCTGNQGLRIIYRIPDAAKSALIKGTMDGLTDYTLAEYGTVATWAEKSTSPYLGCNGAMSACAFRASDSYDDTALDIELNIADSNCYFSNAFTFSDFERTKPDLAIRPYMILNTPTGDTVTIYGGVVIRNIGYVAVQCLNDFTKGTVQYNYVKKIVDYVYPDGYTEWSVAKY